MGIVEEVLTEFETEEFDNCRVEYNERGVIHLHLDAIRIEMTVDEFVHFVNAVERGHHRLKSMKTEG